MLSRDEMEKTVRSLGSDNAGVFGMEQGWAHLQQVPEELTDFGMFLQEYVSEAKPIEVFLEIGTASGGLARFIHDLFKPWCVALVDNNSHQSGARERIDVLNGVPHVEFIGSSEDVFICVSVRHLLTDPVYGGSVDLLFVDGNHDDPYPTVDAKNYSGLVRVGGLIAFHDSVHLDGPAKAVAAMGGDSRWELVFKTYHRYGITALRRIE